MGEEGCFSLQIKITVHVKGSQSRNSKQGRNWCRGHRGKLLPGLLLIVCQPASSHSSGSPFPSVACPQEVGQSTWITNQKNGNLLIGQFYVAIFSINIPSSQTSLGLSQINRNQITQQELNTKCLVFFWEDGRVCGSQWILNFLLPSYRCMPSSYT